MAILFDLHHTLTELTESVTSVWRRISLNHNVDLSDVDDTKILEAMNDISIFQNYQLEHNVDPHWGSDAEDWLQTDRCLFHKLGITDLSDKTIISIEREFQTETTEGPFERFTEDSLTTLKELHSRGYILGICTRRTTDPEPLLKRFGIRHLFDTIQWTGVIGYQKPNPYTLLNGAKEIGVNPRRCAFVGNYVNADVKAAIRSEMMPVLLTWANPYEGPKSPDGILVLETPSDLLQVFSSPSDVVSDSS